MAAMKLYFGENPVGGEVDLEAFDQLEKDVEGKYDKGDPSGLDGGVMQYDNAALMEAAVVANAGEIESLQGNFQELIEALEGFDGSQLQVELEGYFKKYQEDDDAQTSLIYDSAAKMGLAVFKNTQDIETNKSAISDGDAATLRDAKAYADTQDSATLLAANKHSDDNDTKTLSAANDYTDDAISKIPGVEGLEEFEATVEELDENAVRNANKAQNQNPTGGVENIAVVVALPAIKDPNTLYIVTG